MYFERYDIFNAKTFSTALKTSKTMVWRRHQMETFSALLPLCVRGIHRRPVDFPHKGQWHGALMFSLICPWTNGGVNNRDADDLRRYRAHYDVTVMVPNCCRLRMLCLLTKYPMQDTGNSLRTQSVCHSIMPAFHNCCIWFYVLWHLIISSQRYNVEWYWDDPYTC